MTLLVRDEEDIIEANLRHHLAAGIDEIIVVDNRSVDSTPEILKRFEGSGRVRVLHEAGEDYSQWRWVSAMARTAAIELGADWVLHADADEFYASRSGSIRDALVRVARSDSVVAVPRVEFWPVAGGPDPFYARMIVRPVRAVNARGHPLRAKVCHRGHPSAMLTQGNHSVSGLPGSPACTGSSLLIFHYPMRSYEQFARKVRLGGSAYERNAELSAAAREPWRSLYRLLLDGLLPDYYRGRELTAEECAARVRAGRAVVDRRMAARLATLLSPA